MIGTEIKKARLAKGLTQNKLASITKIKQPVLARYESGASIPGSKNLNLLTEALGVDFNRILKDTKPNSMDEIEEVVIESEFNRKIRAIKTFNNFEKKVIEGMLDVIIAAKATQRLSQEKAIEIANILNSK